jgi:hypothetical protein
LVVGVNHSDEINNSLCFYRYGKKQKNEQYAVFQNAHGASILTGRNNISGFVIRESFSNFLQNTFSFEADLLVVPGHCIPGI